MKHCVFKCWKKRNSLGVKIALQPVIIIFGVWVEERSYELTIRLHSGFHSFEQLHLVLDELQFEN